MVRAKTTLPLLTATLLLACTFGFTREAHAQREILTAMGSKGTLAIDQLSGFRVSSLGGVSYAGPIGFSVQSLGETGVAGSKNTQHFTTFWLAPSADYFVIDHLSIGGLFEVMSTGRSVDVQPNANAGTTTTELPSLTSITFIPRVGYLFAINDRFGIWPRGGIGYASQQRANGNDRDTVSGFVLDVDVGFLYRVNENFFLKAAPQITFGLGPSHSTTVANTTFSNDASFFQFAGVAGIGVMWDL